MQAVAQCVRVSLRTRLYCHLRLLRRCGRRGRVHDHRLGDERMFVATVIHTCIFTLRQGCLHTESELTNYCR